MIALQNFMVSVTHQQESAIVWSHFLNILKFEYTLKCIFIYFYWCANYMTCTFEPYTDHL